MKQVVEVSRRSMYHEDEGMACGPVSCTAIMAEIVVDVDGQRVFLYGEWVDIAGDYYYEATTESVFDANKKMLNAESEEDEQKAIDERNRISETRIQDDSIFEPYYAEMEQMIHNEMKAHGIEYFYEDEEEDDEEDEDPDTSGTSSGAMRFVINIVRTDADGHAVERKTVGKFETEIEAIMKLSEEDRKLKNAGMKDSYVEMQQIFE